MRAATKTLKQTRRENDAALNYYAASFGKGPTFALEPEPVQKPSRNRPATVPESEVLRAVMRFLSINPAVAWVRRMNTGSFQIGTGPKARWFRAGFVGCSDILGQMKDGRFLAVEVKAERGKVSDEQQRFIDVVRANGGVAGVARNIGEAEFIIKYALMSSDP